MPPSDRATIRASIARRVLTFDGAKIRIVEVYFSWDVQSDVGGP